MKKRQGRASRWFERVALGGIMTVVAFVVERRLIKVMRKRGTSEEGTPVADDMPSGGELQAPSP